MGDRTNIADALERMAETQRGEATIWHHRSEPDMVAFHQGRADLLADAARLLRADPDTSDERRPCPHCNDEGMVCTLDGDIIGPCDCQRRPR